MIVRKIKPGEVKRTNELFSIAFEIPYQEPSGAPSRENAYQLEKYAAFEDDNETMTSCLSAVPFQMNFDGSVFLMTGIGGVSSLPHFRRNGGIRGCFRMMLPELYAKKVLPEIKRLYEIWQSEYNGMTVNEEWDYAFIEQANPYKNQEFTYLYRDCDGNAAGYMTFHKEVVFHGQKLECTRFVFHGTEGLKGLLTLAKSFASDHLSISFRLPESLHIEPMIKEWSLGAVKRTPVVLGMIRVIDVMQVLQKAKYRGDGSVVIQISDQWIPENEGTFQVDFRNGAATKVRKIKQETAECDIAMGIHTFSQFIYGCLDASALTFCEDVSVADTKDIMEKLKKVFYHKNYYIMEYF